MRDVPTQIKNPDLVARIGGHKKAKKIIKNHMNWKWQVRNMTKILNDYRAQEDKYEKIKLPPVDNAIMDILPSCSG